MNSLPQSLSVEDYVKTKNNEKILFTAGPASLLVENLIGLQPCFGRGDREYMDLENYVLDFLKRLTDHKHIVRMQGAGSLALEMAAINFLSGRVLIVSTGYYSDRLYQIAKFAAIQSGNISRIDQVSWQDIESIKGRYDWVWACPVETSIGLLVPISELYLLACNVGARLMLDATASIGFEEDHHKADVITYSSCKGLFGLVGACFIAYNQSPINNVNSFYLNIKTHADRGVTGPYHSIASLAYVLPNHKSFVKSVLINKDRFMQKTVDYLVFKKSNQPKLCTQVECKVSSLDKRVILYSPRNSIKGSVVCHLGEAHLGELAKGDILEILSFQEG